MKKNLIQLLFAVAFLIPFGSIAQSKIGYVNSEKVLSDIPAIKEANNEIQKFREEFLKEQQGMYSLYEAKVKEFEGNAVNWGETVAKSRAEDIKALELKIQEYEKSGQDRLTKKQQLLLTPLLQKANEAIKKVAEEKGYDLIVDVTNGSVVYIKEDEKNNLSDIVKQEVIKITTTTETSSSTSATPKK